MKTIWKFSIGVDEGVVTVGMPEGAEIFAVGLQGKSLVLWALVSTTAPNRSRAIEIAFTGKELAPARRKWIGTVQSEGSIDVLVWHVFERLEAQA